MYDYLKDKQLNIMLILCGACGILAFLLLITRFLTLKRKWALILMELVALFLLWFDRLAYIYAGDVSRKGYYMVRVSNFMVFFLTSAVVLVFNLFISDYLTTEGGLKTIPKRLEVVGVISVVGMILAVVSSLTGLYYHFDANNVYHRSEGFLIAYIIPIVCPLIQYSVVRQYRKAFSKLIYISMMLYIYIPIFCGIAQVLIYGISMVNMSIVAVSISLYIFTYLDINNAVEHAHEIEIQNMQGEQRRMKRIFDQTAKAFVAAVEKKDDFTKGNAVRIADYAKKLANLAGKDKDFCDNVYYAALLHDVGMIGIPDSVIKDEANPDKWDREIMRTKPAIGKEILSNISEYPYLSVGAASSHERYDGSGYPNGLKGEEIPEIARIIGVADAYVTMTTRKRYRDARPPFVARESFVSGAGAEFDPMYAGLMVKIIDDESKAQVHDDISLVEKELVCKDYRDVVSLGIPVPGSIVNISFNCDVTDDPNVEYSAPSIIVFDSFDRWIHDNEKSIKSYHYLEYGEVWFDNHSICTAARKIVENTLEGDTNMAIMKSVSGKYEISAVKYDDHVKLVMTGPLYKKEVIMALQDGSTSVYIGITGENCSIRDINIEQTDEVIGHGYIPRISEEISYIDHMESDISNVQVNQTCSAFTDSVEIDGKVKLVFHTMSLPVATFVWHCPYALLFSSDSGRLKGKNYRSYALIKLNGEVDNKYDYAVNTFTMKRKDSFPGWDAWKEKNKEGMECSISFERKGNRIITTAENLGISLECTTTINDPVEKVYVALTGDRCALTDIRIR